MMKASLKKRNHSEKIRAHSDLMEAILMAVAGKAREIYMMTSVHDVQEALRRMTSPTISKGLVYIGTSVFNPCSYFAQPLFGMNRKFSQCFDANWEYRFVSGETLQNLVTSFCEHCGKLASSDLPGQKVFCDPSTPNVILKAGHFHQADFRNTLWKKNVFWALFYYVLLDELTENRAQESKEIKNSNARGLVKTPNCTTDSNVYIHPVQNYSATECDQRISKAENNYFSRKALSLFIQRLLWEIQGSTAFVSSYNLVSRNPSGVSSTNEHTENNKQVRNTSNGINDEVDKTFRNLLSGNAIMDKEEITKRLCISRNVGHEFNNTSIFLSTWKCKKRSDVQECVRQVSGELRARHTLSSRQLTVIDNFLKKIAVYSYATPVRSKRYFTRQMSEHISSKMKSNSVSYWSGSLYRMWDRHPFMDLCWTVNVDMTVMRVPQSFPRKNSKASIDTKSHDEVMKSEFRFSLEHDKHSEKMGKVSKDVNSLRSVNDQKNFSKTQMFSSNRKQERSKTILKYSPQKYLPQKQEEQVQQWKTFGMKKVTEGMDVFTPPEFVNIVLVISFQLNDHPQYFHQIEYFHFLYGRHFRHIIFCSAGTVWADHFAKMYPQPMTFIDLHIQFSSRGLPPKHTYSYSCLSEAMRMRHHNIRGYVHVDSDSLFNPWAFSKVIADYSSLSSRTVSSKNREDFQTAVETNAQKQNNTYHVLDKPWLSRYVQGAKVSQMEVLPPSHLSNAHWSVWKDATFGHFQVNAALLGLRDLDLSLKQYLQDLQLLKKDTSADILDTRSNSTVVNKLGSNDSKLKIPVGITRARKGSPSKAPTSNRKLRVYLQRYEHILSNFLSSFKWSEGFENATVHYGPTAFFYVPAIVREEFILLSGEFLSSNVHADLAVPTILQGLASSPVFSSDRSADASNTEHENTKDINQRGIKGQIKTNNDKNYSRERSTGSNVYGVVYVNGSVLNTEHTSLLVNAFSPQDMFLYPWHFPMMLSADRLKFMCKVYLPVLEESLLKYSLQRESR
ncbi:hypothetical protein PoB_005465700 [Plakobranchus ocellatus]|uniref:Protein xylosyltransferase n=1 Tax=Plakobranchus ocellatus TaxID=259542 RepID=A0AAV4C9C8_9GAST|nr:hypothetical protein PoB_005465700 [Plakobranchus ocellatus]